MKLCYKVSLRYNFEINRLHCARCAHTVAQNDFANNAGGQSKTSQASRGLSAIAELLVYFILQNEVVNNTPVFQ